MSTPGSNNELMKSTNMNSGDKNLDPNQQQQTSNNTSLIPN